MKLPIISRKKYDKKVGQLSQGLRDEEQRRNYESQRYNEDLAKLTKRLDEFLPRIFKIKTGYDKDFRTYKLQVAFSDEFIYEGFTHGDSQEMISLLAKQLSRSIERELMTINFARFRSDDGAMK